MLIFGDPLAYQDQRLQKHELTHQWIYVTTLVALLYLHWSKHSVTYDRTDHPNRVIKAGQFPLVVTAVIENVRVTKILMDGGSNISILYKDAFDRLNMDIRKLHTSQSPLHGIVP
jgi:hypothetical protein